MSGANHGRTMQRFEQFWKAYPKKRGENAAKKVWLTMKPGRQLADQILAAIKQQKKQADWKRENGRFIPYPAKWLEEGHWKNVIAEEQETSEHYHALGPGRNPTPTEEKVLTSLREGG